MAPGCDPTVFFAGLQQSLDRALPGLDGASRHQLLSDQFVEGVQPALGAQLRLARATGQLSVERPRNSALKMSPRMVTKRLQINCQARRTDQQPPDQMPNIVVETAQSGVLVKLDAYPCLDEIARSHFSRDAKRIYEKAYYSHAASVASTVTVVDKKHPRFDIELGRLITGVIDRFA
ncbi:hypothetical protein CLF_109163 [Clonorchis sinensis]|uniref:Uncharacterized protein n=1 Tax=Clonorchis sinensis TaxID=79923 RepID=G7YJ12_CLOSI|nr:hypothetical protein CLF_109163 [Clonorchis sinensis]